MEFAKLAEQPVQKSLQFDKDFAFNVMVVAKAGTFLPQHSHPFEHTTLVPFGGVRLWRGIGVDGEFKDHDGPCKITIPAGIEHTFMTKADNTVLICVNRLDENGNAIILREHQLPGVS